MREPFHRECFYVTGTHFLFKKTMPGPNFFSTVNWQYDKKEEVYERKSKGKHEREDSKG